MTEQLATIATKQHNVLAIEKPTREFSTPPAITVLTRKITLLRKRGYDLLQIAEALRGERLDITTPMIKN